MKDLSHFEHHYIDDEIHIYPAGLQTYVPEVLFKEVTAVFMTLQTLCRWLGVNDRDDISYILFRYNHTLSSQVARVTGSLSFDDSKTNLGANIFVGATSTKIPDVAIQNNSNDHISEIQSQESRNSCYLSKCIGVPTLEWDNTRRCFEKQWRTTTVHNGFHELSEDNLFQFSSFHIKWKPLTQHVGKLWSPESRFHHGHVLGTITVVFPVVIIIGTDAAIVRDLITPLL